MDIFNLDDLKQLYIPPPGSHKGQNGKLLIIGGSHLFHAASLWSLQIASKIVDMVFYSSVPENNEIVERAKEEFRNGMVVLRKDLEDYVKEADAILIGPGMVRTEQVQSSKFKVQSLEDINEIEDEGMQTYYLTKYLLGKYPEKKWVIDAGALQMMEPEWLLPLNGNAILTPHPQEFERVFHVTRDMAHVTGEENMLPVTSYVSQMAEKYNCTILLKGEKDTVCSPFDSAQAVRGSEEPSGSRRGEIRCNRISGGNAGMTKGGTGDVLAGLVAALACNNDLWLAATAGSFINKKAGESLFKKVGYYFNASDLAEEIPKVMNQLITHPSPPFTGRE